MACRFKKLNWPESGHEPQVGDPCPGPSFRCRKNNRVTRCSDFYRFRRSTPGRVLEIIVRVDTPAGRLHQDGARHNFDFRPLAGASRRVVVGPAMTIFIVLAVLPPRTRLPERTKRKPSRRRGNRTRRPAGGHGRSCAIQFSRVLVAQLLILLLLLLLRFCNPATARQSICAAINSLCCAVAG